MVLHDNASHELVVLVVIIDENSDGSSMLFPKYP